MYNDQIFLYLLSKILKVSYAKVYFSTFKLKSCVFAKYCMELDIYISFMR